MIEHSFPVFNFIEKFLNNKKLFSTVESSEFLMSIFQCSLLNFSAVIMPQAK